MRFIPTEVKHEDFLVAIKPLLDLCGVTAYEVGQDVHIVGMEGSPAITSIRFDVNPAAGGVEEYPEARMLASADERGFFPPNSEFTIPVTVKVV